MEEISVCSAGGCQKRVHVRGLCRAHYARLLKYGDALGVAPSRDHAPGCAVDGCGKLHYAKGYCEKHHRRLKLYGDPLAGSPTRTVRSDQCLVDECLRPHFSLGYCRRHYYRREAPVVNGLAPNEKPALSCAVKACPRAHYAHGYCPKHYQRWKAYGDAEAPYRRALDGEGYRGVNNQGYVVLKRRGKTVLEHRLVIEQVLGRKLYPFENVHHKNGVRSDNRPKNLELWVKAQPCGQRPEDLVAFVIQHYPDLARDALR